jgi:endonuclease/exonuclease/phosphatase family metal-dependent hydrolase
MGVPADPATGNRLHLLHWNIHSWQTPTGASNAQAVRELIAETSPHVVSLVEVDEPWGRPETLATVASELGYTWLLAPSFEFGDNEPRGGFGNALLTTLPILAVQHWQLLWPSRVYDGTEPSEQRTFVLAKLRFGGRSIWVGSTHLPRSDAEARRSTLRRLMTLTGTLDAPWLVCADFNEPSAGWASHYPEVVTSRDPAVATYPAEAPREAIDYFVGSPGLELDTEVLKVSGSDHWAVVGEVPF